MAIAIGKTLESAGLISNEKILDLKKNLIILYGIFMAP